MRDVLGFCYEAFAPHLSTYDIRYPWLVRVLCVESCILMNLICLVSWLPFIPG